MHAGRKWVLGLLAIVLIAGAGTSLYLYMRPQASARPDELVLYGNVDIREADLAFNISGRVAAMLVEEGDKVKKGQLLARLETPIYDADVAAAQADVSAKKAALDRLLAGSRPEEIKRAREDVQAIKAQLDDASAVLKRTQQLALDRFAPQQQLDADQARVNNLSAQLRAAQQVLSLAVQGPRSEDIAQARAQLSASQAQLQLALRRLGYTRLYAAEDGIINTRIMEPGAVVQASSPVYTLALTSPLWVRTYVDEPDLGRIRPGTKAAVFSDAYPGHPYEGWVGFISPIAEFTPKTVETPQLRTSLVYRLRVYVKNADGSLLQGMPVSVHLKTDEIVKPADRTDGG